MSDDQQEKTLGQMLDEDKGFIASRRLLMTLSILLLVSVFGGVSIKEANTFIFKIEFLNPKALNALLAVAVFFCAVRYYAFSTPYHVKVQRIWGSKMLRVGGVTKFQGSGRVIKFFPQYSLLSSDIQFIEAVTYKNNFFFRRRLVLPVIEPEEGHLIFPGDWADLWSFSEYWRPLDLLKMYYVEVRLRFDTILKNREYLDVLFPYWVAVVAVISYAGATFFPVELASLFYGNHQQLWLPHSI